MTLVVAAGPGLLADGDARDAIEHDLERNLFVEAGAGTGKTTALVRRVVRLFATGRVPEPSRLAAITFTEAAAAELRDRVRIALERAAAPGGLTDATERARCRDAADARFREVVTTVVDGIEAGQFPANPGGEDYRFGAWTHDNCSWCEFDRVCPTTRGEAWIQLRRAPELQAYVGLAEASNEEDEG